MYNECHASSCSHECSARFCVPKPGLSNKNWSTKNCCIVFLLLVQHTERQDKFNNKLKIKLKKYTNERTCCVHFHFCWSWLCDYFVAHMNALFYCIQIYLLYIVCTRGNSPSRWTPLGRSSMAHILQIMSVWLTHGYDVFVYNTIRTT